MRTTSDMLELGGARRISGINRFLNTIDSPTEASEAINRSVNAQGGQLAAGEP